MAHAWTIKIDWDNDDSFADEDNEAIYTRDVNIKRGRRYYVRMDGQGFERVMMGDLTLVLENSTARFDPWNSSSAIYPNVVPGRKCQVICDGDTLFTGFLTDIKPISGKDERVMIRAVDGISKLQKIDITDVLYTGETVATLLAAILTAASWGDGSNIDADTDIVPYWWTTDESAWEALNNLAEAWMGVMFINKSGEVNFYARQHSETATVTLTQAKLLREIITGQPWEVIRNHVTVFAKPRRVYASQELWRLVDTPLIAAGDSATYWADFFYDNLPVPADNVVSPASTTDYTMNAQADGGGADLTGNFTVTPTKYATRAKLVVANTGGTDGYITLLKIRGDALAETRTRIEREDSTSQGLYDVNKLVLEYDAMQSIDNAEDFAAFLISVLPDPLAFPIIQLEERDEQFDVDLFDKVALTIAKKSIAADFDVGAIEHQTLTENLQSIRTTLWLEPSLDDRYWVFTATVNESTILGF